MDKRKLHHLLVRLRPLSYWYFVGVIVAVGIVTAFALRQNNVRAIQLRDKVLEVDKNGGDVEAALKELREYTYSHMNARLSSDTGIYPPVQLKYRYERLVAAEKARVQSANADIYAQAQRDCEARFPHGLSGSNRIPCIQQYIDARSAQTAKEQPIPDALYKFDFVSPAWSPDLAGFLVILLGVLIILFVVRVLGELWLRSQVD